MEEPKVRRLGTWVPTTECSAALGPVTQVQSTLQHQKLRTVFPLTFCNKVSNRTRPDMATNGRWPVAKPRVAKQAWRSATQPAVPLPCRYRLVFSLGFLVRGRPVTACCRDERLRHGMPLGLIDLVIRRGVGNTGFLVFSILYPHTPPKRIPGMRMLLWGGRGGGGGGSFSFFSGSLVVTS